MTLVRFPTGAASRYALTNEATRLGDRFLEVVVRVVVHSDSSVPIQIPPTRQRRQRNND
jgi:hypothetical protein